MFAFGGIRRRHRGLYVSDLQRQMLLWQSCPRLWPPSWPGQVSVLSRAHATLPAAASRCVAGAQRMGSGDLTSIDEIHIHRLAIQVVSGLGGQSITRQPHADDAAGGGGGGGGRRRRWCLLYGLALALAAGWPAMWSSTPHNGWFGARSPFNHHRKAPPTHCCLCLLVGGHLPIHERRAASVASLLLLRSSFVCLHRRRQRNPPLRFDSHRQQ